MATRDSDIEDEVAGYQARMSQLAKVLARHTSRGLRALQNDIRALMERGGYDPLHTSIFLNSQADASTIMRLDELVRQAPEGMRAKAWKDVIDAVANGRLTNRKAVRYLSRFNLFSVIDDMVTTSARILSDVAEDGFLHGTFMLQKSMGAGWNIDGMSNARTQIIVDSVFSQKEAKKFVSVAADMADDQVLYEMLKGSDPERVEKSVDYVNQATQYRAKREARTTITETASQAHKESYDRHGVKMYQFKATYDERTCPVCGSMDGNKVPVKEAKAGRNYPPMHPNCRCTTIAVFSKEIEELMAPRVVTDYSTGDRVQVARDFNYRDWYKTFGPGRTDGVEYKPKKRKR